MLREIKKYITKFEQFGYLKNGRGRDIELIIWKVNKKLGMKKNNEN